MVTIQKFFTWSLTFVYLVASRRNAKFRRCLAVSNLCILPNLDIVPLLWHCLFCHTVKSHTVASAVTPLCGLEESGYLGFPSGDLNDFWCIKDSLSQVTPIYNFPVMFKLALVYMLPKTALGGWYRDLSLSSTWGRKLSFNSSVLPVKFLVAVRNQSPF